jgi:hypothetical protein
LVEDGVDATEEDITEDVKVLLGAARLDASVDCTIAQVLESKVFWLNLEELVANSERHSGERGSRGVLGEYPALLLSALLGAWNRGVDLLKRGIVDEGESGASVGDGGVSGSLDGLTIDGSTSRVKHPESLRVVDRRVRWCLATESVLVDVAEGVEAVARLVGKKCSEELGVRGNVLLSDHVLHGCGHLRWLDCVDGAPSEAK